jgi:pantetheine-phosphate adenylyltransferase
MTLMNRHLAPELETVFMVPNAQSTFVSSRLTKEIFKLGGPVHGLVPPAVERRMRAKQATIVHT